MKAVIPALAAKAHMNDLAITIQGHWKRNDLRMRIKYTRDRSDVPITMMKALSAAHFEGSAGLGTK